MKRTLAILLMLGFLAVPAAYAAESAGGCGLGQQTFQGQTGIIPHILAMAINRVSSHTSSMTSGTAGCDTDAVIKAEHEATLFVSWNMGRVSEDMARGDGEYLHSLANLMGCEAAYGDFAALTHAKYGQLVGDGSSHTAMLDNLKREISANPTLSATCTRVS